MCINHIKIKYSIVACRFRLVTNDKVLVRIMHDEALVSELGHKVRIYRGETRGKLCHAVFVRMPELPASSMQIFNWKLYGNSRIFVIKTAIFTKLLGRCLSFLYILKNTLD